MRRPARDQTFLVHWLALGGLACLYTLFNACKPLVVDDAAYFYFATQLARAWLDPYGFEMIWHDWQEPANHVLAPPVLPYWWALGLRILGSDPFFWKLWLLPFSTLFVAALFALARRCARGLEWPLVVLTAFSPALLPSLNLMLDVPALALGLGALVLFLRAAERASWLLVLVAGLMAGVAMQTKYTAFVMPLAMMGYSLLLRRPLRGLVAAALSVSVFVAWEAFVAVKYGESHFLYGVQETREVLRAKADLLLLAHPTASAVLKGLVSLWVQVEAKAELTWPLLTTLGGLAPCVGLLGLVALGASRRLVLAAGLAVLLGHGLIAVVPARYAAWLGGQEGSRWRFHLDDAVYGTFGLLLCGVLTVVGSRLWRTRKPGARFLVIWLALEVAGYFALTPFPAARRVLGVVVAATLLVGRLASRTCRDGPDRRRVWSVTALSVLAGLGFFFVDVRGAVAHKMGAELAATLIREREPGARIWYVGHWGFQYYAERAGMMAVVPNHTRLHAGDWLVVPDRRQVHQQGIALDPEHTELAEVCAVADSLPLRTVFNYYGGHIPLAHHEGPRLTVRVYRVRAEHTAAWNPR